MSYLKQNWPTGWYIEFANGKHLLNVHNPALCEGRGCAIHNHPSDHPLKDAALYWRTDRGILERICEHGVGHPDYDSARYLASVGKNYENIHGCDGCCSGNYYGE